MAGLVKLHCDAHDAKFLLEYTGRAILLVACGRVYDLVRAGTEKAA